ncbi:MAG: hypothetical protein ACTS41_01905 [Candidatus Hodgkinia cicadicola]
MPTFRPFKPRVVDLFSAVGQNKRGKSLKKSKVEGLPKEMATLSAYFGTIDRGRVAPPRFALCEGCFVDLALQNMLRSFAICGESQTAPKGKVRTCLISKGTLRNCKPNGREKAQTEGVFSKTRRTSVQIDVRTDRSTLIKMKLGKWKFLGGTLRRALMSSAEGWAIVGLSFGSASRFQLLSKVNGIAEDVSAVLVNAKRLTFVGGGGGTCFRAKINTMGKFNVTGRDVKLPEGVELINPDERVCRLTGGVVPRMELLVAKGRGCMTSAEVKVAFGATFDEFVWADVSFNPIERATCFSKTDLQAADGGFDCKLVVVGKSANNPIDAFVEVCEELIFVLGSAEIVPSGGLVKPTDGGADASEGFCPPKWTA